MPQNIITKYYNMHEIKYHSQFPQLLFSMPLDDVIDTSENKKFEFKTYNYFDRGDKGIVKDAVEVVKRNLTYNGDNSNLRPPRTFQRLNLNSLNLEAKDCDYKDYQYLTCNNNKKYCFENNKAFVCEANTVDPSLPYYLDIFNLTCNQFCRKGYMRALRDTDKVQSQYCSKSCGEFVENCPYEHELYTSPNFFTCKTGFFDLYYNFK